ncbi:MAG TPA: efflux RND transporter periplasmic adaptor subunit [Acidobacteriaceae bacterium]|nr:efflux RND transporter periplasmic adaptor subunit [Acidobacteriaceae bacterium]
MNSQPSASIAPKDRPPTDESAAPAKKRRHLWVWAVVLIIFGLLFYWVITEQQKSQQAAMGGGRRGGAMLGVPEPVVPATATSGSLGVYLDAIGTVTPVYMDSITAQVTGVITEVHYTEGQMVRKGDPLVDIDPRPYQAQLTEAQGALERDQNLLAEAQMDLKRYQEAWSKNAIPRQTLEDQEKLVLQDQGTVKNDEGTVQYDQVQLAYCHITSPITGRVGLRLVDPGNLVTANSTTTLVVVAQMQPITVIFAINEDDLPQVTDQMRQHHPLSVEAWNRDNSKQLGSGKLMTTDNQIDTETGTVKLRASFANKDSSLFPNQFVNTRLLVKTLDNQILVPSSAVQHNGDVAFVYVIEPGAGPSEPAGGGSGGAGASASKGGGHKGKGGGNAGGETGQSAPKELFHVVQTNVKTGVTDKGMTAVTGIQPGQKVANSSFEKLVNNSTVYMSNQKLPETGTTISGESGAP